MDPNEAFKNKDEGKITWIEDLHYQGDMLLKYEPSNELTFYSDNVFLFKILAKDGKIEVEYNDSFPADVLAEKTARTFWQLWPDFLTEIIKGSMEEE